MAISQYQASSIVREVERTTNLCLSWIQATTFTYQRGGTPTPIRGTRLYRKLFGDDPLIVFSRTLSQQAEVIDNLLSAGQKASVFPNVIRYPDCTTTNGFCFTLREYQTNVATEVNLYLPIPKPTFRIHRLITNQYSRTQAELQFRGYATEDGVPGDLTHSYFVPIIEEVYGPEFLEKIDHVVAFHDMTYLASSQLDSFLKKCKSIGGAFNKLPILNSLLPKWKPEHVQFTRQTPDPDPKLVSVLEALCAVNQARISQQGQEA